MGYIIGAGMLLSVIAMVNGVLRLGSVWLLSEFVVTIVVLVTLGSRG
jgi:hypothetical protein